jgi:hypothetical protein
VAETSFGYFDLLEAFAGPGCAVCNLTLRDVHHHLDSLLYEYVNEPETNDAFRSNRGLCSEHGWQLRQFKGSVVGVSILYEAVLDEVLKIVERTTVTPQSRMARLLGAQNDHSASHLADQLEPEATCTVCQHLEACEARYLQILRQQLGDSRLQQAYRDSEGLCLPHFRQLLREANDSEHVEWLISIQRDIWLSLKDEVSLFIAKNDFTHAGEPIGAEGTSWQRAIARMAGEKGVFGTRRGSKV